MPSWSGICSSCGMHKALGWKSRGTGLHSAGAKGGETPGHLGSEQSRARAGESCFSPGFSLSAVVPKTKQ